MAGAHKKLFVLDTNVILHDSSCIYQFDEHDIVIPVSVLEELDQFKKGNSELNFNAREFVRSLDALSGDKLFDQGLKIGPHKGRILLRLEEEFHADLLATFLPDKPDHRILNTAYNLVKKNPARQVVLVTKDVNLRMKAKSIGLTAQDYTTDHVKNPTALYAGHRFETNIAEDIIDSLYRDPYEVEVARIGFKEQVEANEFVVMRNGKKSALAVIDANGSIVKKVDKTNAYGITPRNAEQAFAINALINTEIQLVTVTGKAGTGKTLLALAAALERRRNYRQIYLARPVVPLSNKDIGYLPGDIQSKLDPYMQPLYDNLGVIQSNFEESRKQSRIKDFLQDEKLVISPLSYIRGRSLVRIFFIVDEAQNLTPHEVKTIITRAGEGTKLVFTGDIFQIDHPYLNSYSNGLSYLIEKMKGQKLYAHINLEKGERSELAELASNLL